MKIKITIRKPARKFIEKQDMKTRQRISDAIFKLPFDGDVKPITGKKNVFRLRIGEIRIVYLFENDVIEIADAGYRGNIYK
jgi:mRNA interferase RelE/StbE